LPLVVTMVICADATVNALVGGNQCLPMYTEG